MADVRCSVCGQFIGSEQFANGEINVEYTPLSDLTREHFEYWHKFHDKYPERNLVYVAQ